MLKGVCAETGWCTSNPDALRDTDMLKHMVAARDGMHSSAHNAEHCTKGVLANESGGVAKSVRENMRAIGAAEGSMMRCCDWRMVAAHHHFVFAPCKPEHRRLMSLCGHITRLIYLRPGDRTHASVLALAVLAMQWQSLMKQLFPAVPKFKQKHGVGYVAMFGRYFHFWSMEAPLQYRLQSHRNTITERHEAYFAGMKKILRLTSSCRVDQDYLLKATERSQMEAIFKEIHRTSDCHDQQQSQLSAVFNRTSKLTDVTLTHEEVASTDYLVLRCMFMDYHGSGDWFKVKVDSPVMVINGRKVQEVIVRVTEGGDNGRAMLL